MATMGAHRSTTPSDSCSAPTSPASLNISPSNSPELNMNNVGGCTTTNSNNNNNQSNGQTSTNQSQFNQSYISSPSYQNQQQTNLLQHQLEQFRMTNDTEPGGGGYVVISLLFIH